MGMHRKNKSAWIGHSGHDQPWFRCNVRRQRRREQIAVQSRRLNRKPK